MPCSSWCASLFACTMADMTGFVEFALRSSKAGSRVTRYVGRTYNMAAIPADHRAAPARFPVRPPLAAPVRATTPANAACAPQLSSLSLFRLQKHDSNGLHHRVLEDALRHAHSGSGMVRLLVLGRTIVLAGSPAAQHALHKQAPFIPKPVTIYAALEMLVRHLAAQPRLLRSSTTVPVARQAHARHVQRCSLSATPAHPCMYAARALHWPRRRWLCRALRGTRCCRRPTTRSTRACGGTCPRSSPLTTLTPCTPRCVTQCWTWCSGKQGKRKAGAQVPWWR
jgi:hypothetical protein